MHLVGFNIVIYYDARSYKRQISTVRNCIHKVIVAQSTKKIPHHSWNPDIHQRNRKISRLVTIVNQINPFHPSRLTLYLYWDSSVGILVRARLRTHERKIVSELLIEGSVSFGSVAQIFFYSMCPGRGGLFLRELSGGQPHLTINHSIDQVKNS